MVSVPSSLADYQWDLISNSQYVLSLEKSGQDSYDSKWTFQSVSSTGNHRRPVNPKQPRETQATRQAVNPEEPQASTGNHWQPVNPKQPQASTGKHRQPVIVYPVPALIFCSAK